MIPLKYQTSGQNRVIGQIISTDGNTITSSGTVIANTDIRLWKYNSTALVNKSTSGATYLSDGVWSVTFSSDDADTLGAMIAFTHISSGLVTRQEFEVMAANRYDSMVSTSDYLQVDAIQIAGVASTDQIATSTELADAIWITSTSRTLTTGAISSLTFSSGAISTLTISTSAWDVGSHSNWANSTKTLTAFSTALWSTAFHSTAFFSTAFWSTAFYSTAISDNVSTSVWNYATRTLTNYSSCILSTAGRDAVVDAIWDEIRGDHVSTLSIGYTQSTLYTLPAGAISTTDQDNISNATWANSTRTLTAGAAVSTTDYDEISSVTWLRSTRSLTDRSSFALSTIAQTAVSNEVWNNSTKILSSGAAIWTAATRTLTDLSSAVLSTVGLDAIWTASTRSLTDRSSFSLSTTERDNIWTHSTRSLTSLSSFTLSTLSQDAISNAVWANSTKRLSTTQSFDVTGNIMGNLSGSVNSVSSAVAFVTDRSSFALSTIAADNIFGAYVESTETVKDSLKIIRAASAGLSSGGASTQVKFYGATGAVARITADVSTDGNRTVITTDLT